MRVLKAVAATGAMLGAGAAVALAQAPVPTVEVSVSASAVTASAPVAPGPTRFVFASRERRTAQGVFLAAVKRGYTAEEAMAALRRSPDDSFAMIDSWRAPASAPAPVARSPPRSAPERPTC